MQRRAGAPGGLGRLLRHTGDGQYRSSGGGEPMGGSTGGLGGLLRHTGDGQYRGGGDTGRAQGEAFGRSTLSTSGFASGQDRHDSRGVRNEDLTTPSFSGGGGGGGGGFGG